MNSPFLFSSGIFVLILFLLGIVYTFKEFSEMNKNPSDFRKNKGEDNKPEVIDKE